MLSKTILLLAAPLSAIATVVHSHNDYTRDEPLFSALDVGVSSVEADIWLQDDGGLLVGHTEGDLEDDKTLLSLYIQPILDIINGDLESVTPISNDSPLQLLIDLKTDGDGTFDGLVTALEPLRSGGFLTTWTEDGGLVQGAVTIVGTGNTPIEKVLDLSPRDVFFDAKIDELADSSPADGLSWGPEISPLASADFYDAVGWLGILDISDNQHNTIVQLLADAHDANIKSRFWNTNDITDGVREKIWKELVADGTDFLNADDLQAAQDFLASQ